MELKNLALRELKLLEARVKVEIERRRATSKKRLIGKFRELAREAGLEPSSVLLSEETEPKQRKPRPKKEKLPPVYFSPLNPNEGWSGRGKRPQWVVNWLGNGGLLEDLKRKR